MGIPIGAAVAIAAGTAIMGNTRIVTRRGLRWQPAQFFVAEAGDSKVVPALRAGGVVAKGDRHLRRGVSELLSGYGVLHDR